MHTVIAESLFLFAFLALSAIAIPRQAAADGRSLLEDPKLWKSIASDGVKVHVTPEVNASGKTSLRIDFDFTAGAGYCGATCELPIDLPENYEFDLSLHGEGPANNLEFKLVDPNGLDVWWINRRAYEWPSKSTKIVNQKRHFQFAWGPSAGAPLKKLGHIELMIAAAEGGKGTVWIDDLTFASRPPFKPYTGNPTVTTTSGDTGLLATLIGKDASPWTVAATDQNPALTIDFGQPRDLGGIIVYWQDRQHASDFDIQVSDDGEAWQTIRQARGGTGLPAELAMPDLFTQFIRLRFLSTSDGSPVSVARIEILEHTDAANQNAFYQKRSERAAKGLFPRYYSGKQSFWTVMGQPGDDREALINEEGQIEVDRKSFSVEPFVFCNGKLLTWADATHEQSMRNGWIPIPTVIRRHEPVELSITALAAGDAGKSALHAAYTVRNTATYPVAGELVLAVRPLQVLPPWQDLNITGGWSPIRTIEVQSNSLLVNNKKRVIASSNASLGAAVYDAGDPLEQLAVFGKSILQPSVECPQNSASGLIQWNFSLPPGESRTFLVCIPFHDAAFPKDYPKTPAEFAQLCKKVESAWQTAVGHATFELPASASQFADTIRATQAYILINHDGNGFQPGSRTYDRSWMRDGSMTSTAMLELGHTELVKRFIEWYAPFQFPSGKIPCVVDRRGPDPVAENDSNGQFLWLIANYYRYTGDKELVRKLFPRIKLDVEYIQSLIAQRMTEEFGPNGPARQEPGKSKVPALAFRGLMPESISHEGYSAKPMHSFWDQFYTVRGLHDAVYLAAVVDDDNARQQWQTIADRFEKSVIDSICLSQQAHGINYLPGCVELGDFDSTSSTIAIWPTEIADRLPEAWVTATFDRYWTEFVRRRDTNPATWEAYTPYELRHIGAFIRLGRKEQAWEMLKWFLSHQRLTAWRHWAEVVWRDRDTPRMIGDMPHTWCGSDFLNSMRAMFVYEDEKAQSIVLFAGIPDAWCTTQGKVGFDHLKTPYGDLSGSIQMLEANTLRIQFNSQRLPPGGITIASPLSRPIKEAHCGARGLKISDRNTVSVDVPSGEIELRY